MLIVLAGLPGSGKTSLARPLAAALGAVHLRIDTVEQAIVDSGLAAQPLGPVGYLVGYALAGDFLRQGFTVIAESVNPLEETRRAWRAVGEAAGVRVVELEVVCSDRQEHERRVTSRTPDIPNLVQPTWQQVQVREYHPWTSEHLVVDLAGEDAPTAAARLARYLREQP